MTDEKLIDWLAECRYDPLRFVMGAFEWGKGQLRDFDGPDKWQREYLKELGKAVKRKERYGGPVRMAVASGHGVGKSAVTSWVTLWYMSTRPGCLGTVTANTERQLKNRTWRELAKWHKMSLVRDMFKWEKESFRSVDEPETWFTAAIPWSESNSEAFAGQHEKYTFMIFDEASGIADVIWQVASGAMTTPGAMWLAFGNPTRPSGMFYDCWQKRDKDTGKLRWIVRNIDSRSAKVADKKYLNELVQDYGEDSDYVRVRVLGQFPRQSSAQLIPTNLVEAAMVREAEKDEYEQYPLMMGVDIARYGDDQSCIVWRRGPKIIKHEFHKDNDLVTMARIIATHLEANPCQCFLDEVGIGAGVLDMVNRMGYDVMGVSAGRRSTNPRVYHNLRIELWDAMKKWMETADIPNEQRIRDQLVAPEYSFNRETGRMLLERKEDLKKRGVESPDFADALSLTFIVPSVNGYKEREEDEFISNLRGGQDYGSEYRDEHTGY